MGSDQLLFSTARIEATNGKGLFSVGTGFYFRFQIGANFYPLLVTNKHVLKGADSVKFFLHVEDSSKGIAPFQVTIANISNLIIEHPEESVDIAAIVLGPVLNQISSQNKKPFFIPLGEESVLTQSQLEDLFGIENVVMVGYPVGLWDQLNNFPILRRGSTASHPSTDFNGQPHGVVDIAAFPGSSGSPILIFETTGFTTRTGTMFGAGRVILLGALFAGPQINLTGEVTIQAVPTGKLQTSTMSSIHLGYYVKASEILKLKSVLTTKISNQSAKT